MKKLVFISIAMIGICSHISAQSSSVIEFKISSTQGATGTMKGYYSTVGNRMEMDMKLNNPQAPMAGLASTTIIKNDKPTTVYTLNDKSKTYTVTETKTPATTATDKPEDYTVKVIGKEKIGNYNCVHSFVTKGKRTNEYWTTKEIPEYEKYNKIKSGNKFAASTAEYDAMVKAGAEGFMVKTLTNDERGGTFTMELVKFEKKDVASSMFEIPAGYTQSTSTAPGVPGMPNIDVNKIQNMTPEERAKYIEDMKKQYGTPPPPPKKGN